VHIRIQYEKPSRIDVKSFGFGGIFYSGAVAPPLAATGAGNGTMRQREREVDEFEGEREAEFENE
jgi:hypothetical protein